MMDLQADDYDFFEIVFHDEGDEGTRHRSEFTDPVVCATIYRLIGAGFLEEDGTGTIAITDVGYAWLNRDATLTEDTDEDTGEDGDDGDGQRPHTYHWWSTLDGGPEHSGDVYCCLYQAVHELRGWHAEDPFRPDECVIVHLPTGQTTDVLQWLNDHAGVATDGTCTC